MVIWLVGLSASGKSTLGRLICRELKKESPNTVLVDGDEIRHIFRHDRGEDCYSVKERRKNADRICEMCAWLDRQGINVVCSILSIFEESRVWNRRTYSKYFEVYISVPMNVLRKRDKKNIYAPALCGKVKNVVGVDIPFTPPGRSDYVFDNSREQADLSTIAQDIISKAKKRGSLL